VLRAVDRDVREVGTIEYCGLVSLVEFEWVGTDRSLEGGPCTRGANATSADALLVAVTAPDTRRAYLLEWKYVEEYRPGRYLGVGVSGKTRRTRYEALLREADSPFVDGVTLDDLLCEPLYQIMRLLLLGRKMVRERQLLVEEAKLVVVCPRENTAYRDTITSCPLAVRLPEAKTVEQLMRRILRRPADFAIVSQEELLAALRTSPLAAQLGPWLAYQAERYGW